MTFKAELLLLFFIFTAVLSRVTTAQQRSYFPNMIFVKFKSSNKGRDKKANMGVDPKQQIRTFLSGFGYSNMKQAWKLNNKASLHAKNSSVVQQAGDQLKRIYEIHYLSDADPAALAAKISKMPGIEYAEPKYIRYMQEIPDDSISNPYAEFHLFDQAWDITHGSADVTVAIVDGGVGYTHPDLDSKLWVNTDEIPSSVRSQVDQNGDGTVTSPEVLQYLQQNSEDNDSDGTITLRDAVASGSSLLTGSDTDGNDYADDIFGYDFWSSGGYNGQPVTTDNDPFHDGTDHGTHVAGITAAETNNNQGMYGTGYNVHYMAVKAGGIPDNPGTPDDNESDIIGFGFQGIIYAAESGADVINCSWGGGGFSQIEQDVVYYVNSLGSLIVAAAGNENTDGLSFPAAYDDILSVGSVETDNTISFYSNYGYKLDVLATGTRIKSTVFNNQYDYKSGTSMATPVVAGLAGLIKSVHPGWAPQRIATQIRATALSIDNSNASELTDKLGKGKINAYDAVNTDMPGISPLSITFAGANGGKLALGEAGNVKIKLINYGHATGNFVISVSSLSGSDIDILESAREVSTLSTGDTTTVSLGIRIHTDFDLTKPPTLRIDFTDTNYGYEDFSIARYTNILFDVMAANNVKMSFGADGTVGFTDPSDGNTGVGFIPREPSGTGYTEGENVLFEGGLMVEINGRIYDAVRGLEGVQSKDFDPIQIFKTGIQPSVSDEDGSAQFSIADSGSSRHAVIDMSTYAFNDTGLQNVVFVQYEIYNPSIANILKNVYVGLFNDWDIGENSSLNSSAYSNQDSVLYLFNPAESDQPVVAVSPLNSISSALAIDNALEGQRDSVTFGLYDGYTDDEKRASMHAGTQHTSISNTDVSAVMATGPYTILPHASASIGFVYAFGDDPVELKNQIGKVREKKLFRTSGTGLVSPDEIPDKTELHQNFPNPFRTSTNIRFDLKEESDVTLTVYDVLGRKIVTLINSHLQARTHFVVLNGDKLNLSSGVYFVRLKTRQGIQTIPMTLIK